MNRTIKGNAKYRDGSPAVGVKVTVVTDTDKRWFSGNEGAAVTDIDGNYSMTFKSEPNQWISATSNLSGAFWNQSLNDRQDTYNIDFNDARGETLLDTVTIVANRPKPKPQTVKPAIVPTRTWFQKNWWWVVGSSVLLTGIVVFVITRDKDKK